MNHFITLFTFIVISSSVFKTHKTERNFTLNSNQQNPSEINRKKVLAEQEKKSAEMRKTSPYMEEYYPDFPLKYQVPICPSASKDDLFTHNSCVLIVYYAKPGQSTWTEINAGTYILMKGKIDATFHFYGKKGWKYAYSWDGGNTKPFRLTPINVKKTWNVD